MPRSVLSWSSVLLLCLASSSALALDLSLPPSQPSAATLDKPAPTSQAQPQSETSSLPDLGSAPSLFGKLPKVHGTLGYGMMMGKGLPNGVESATHLGLETQATDHISIGLGLTQWQGGRVLP
ncbi:hypothetical protein [Pseudomonas oryzihabitans]|uniref:Uncharacterized protein n=1 Tax=Pseudomonas oryzihabitans TaxID=47885 RepID=A0AAJ2BJ28_9PSED|nr:hypothetical protein [Pseudomonas psychrotolerans]MDR6235189.1 hypothetical protein [Pseudomonas psychrotolerans]MDR6355589.1 hypothetical protein [Pseudomonas psychrotolerans]